ncbi:MAG TPA: TonB family protein [Pyrinomonadaceae bacterium]|nr:TonB family protein [Pyrinomonadaceae bacterium]
MGVEPEEEFVSDDELKSLLKRWVAPGPSRVLDKRIATSFAREFSGAEEVVLMKFCSVCKEEFADKFSFCPVDGNPLTVTTPPVEDPSLTVDRDPSMTVSRDNKTPEIESTAAFSSHDEETAVNDPIYVASNTSSALALRDEYHLTIMDDSGLMARLSHEIKDTAHQYELTWPEFKRDPFGFTKRAFVGYGQKFRLFLGKPNVLIAMGAAFLGMVALVGAVMLMDRAQGVRASRIGLGLFTLIASGLLVALFSTWLGRERGAAVMGAEASDSRSVVAAMVTSFVFLFAILGIIIGIDYRHRRQQEAIAQNQEELQVEQMLDIPDEQPTPDPGTAGLNKGSGGGSKPKPERAAGGGGGGREEAKPASFGKVPQASLTIPQVVAPDPKPPQIKNPSLPVAATVVADPMLVPPDARVLPYGDYKSKSTDPSSGPGTGNGIGTGTGGGIGPGEGGGLGPGRGGNIGGGDRNDGGGGPGGGGGGGYDRIFTGKDVTTKARLISKPEPQYTEDARKNQVTGTVVLKVVFASNGTVSNIRTVSGLPYGLTERAIAAARQIKFVPATKDGHQVSMWMQLEYNFNLY